MENLKYDINLFVASSKQANLCAQAQPSDTKGGKDQIQLQD